jgi:hypothetical protein
MQPGGRVALEFQAIVDRAQERVGFERCGWRLGQGDRGGHAGSVQQTPGDSVKTCPVRGTRARTPRNGAPPESPRAGVPARQIASFVRSGRHPAAMAPDTFKQPAVEPDRPRRVIAPARTPTAQSAGVALRQEDVTGAWQASDTATGDACPLPPAA